MCGRFNVTSDPLHQLIVEITGRGFLIDDRYNLAPTEQVPVLLQTRAADWDLRDMRWWLTPWWSDGPSAQYSMFNAKAETLEKSRAFRDPFRERRCIVPATGYYEWRREGKVKLPTYMTPAAGTGFAFAGLWDRWRSNDQVVESCTIVTAAAPESMRAVHHRIPVHLTHDEARRWLDPDTDVADLKALLAPTIRVPIQLTPVSTWVNNARNKDGRCVEAVGESRVVAVA